MEEQVRGTIHFCMVYIKIYMIKICIIHSIKFCIMQLNVLIYKIFPLSLNFYFNDILE